MSATVEQIKDCMYLSEYISELPENCILNKGITGCGGTTLELQSKRNSIILCPTRNLVTSKASLGYFGVDGNVTKTAIKNYLITENGYKKIVATYDALPKLMEVIPNYQEYFLLIDEYHLLFNDYSLRNSAITFILNNFYKFNKYCFLTATPLKPEFILEELKDLPQITYEWNNAVPVNITIKDTYYVQKELLNLIDIYKDRNLHIFLNSVSTIYKITEKLLTDDFRVVCSENSKAKIKNFAKVTDPVKKLNFYTSCAFEGVDIYDPNGYCIILCDTNISTTVLDIATKVRQVCGRLRDSIYKDQVTLILNTNKHRYAGTTNNEFNNMVAKSEELGKAKEDQFNNATEIQKEADLRVYTKEGFSNIYVNLYDGKLFYDVNLKKLDLYNYKLISEIYNSSISILKECKSNNIVANIQKSESLKGRSWIREILLQNNKSEYTYNELETIFAPVFEKYGLKWSQKSSIKDYFPTFKKHKKMVNKKTSIYYKFVL